MLKVYWFFSHRENNETVVKAIHQLSNPDYSFKNNKNYQYLIIKRAYAWFAGAYTCLCNNGSIYTDFTYRIHIAGK